MLGMRNGDFQLRAPSEWSFEMGRTQPYGCLNFVFDCLLTVLTGGFWLIWIFIREMRRGNA